MDLLSDRYIERKEGRKEDIYNRFLVSGVTLVKKY
jgi:hypothetical protein